MPFIKTGAQVRIIDSLKQELSEAKDDTAKVLLLSQLSFKYTWAYADTAVFYAEKSLKLAQALNFARGVALAQQNLCRALTTLGNYLPALHFGFGALSFYEKEKDTIYLIDALSDIALCYRNQNDLVNALMYCRRGLSLSERFTPDTWTLGMLQGLISSIYEKDNQLDSAIKYARLAYAVDSNWSGILYVLGSAHTKKGHYGTAMDYFRKAIPIAERNHAQIDLTDVYNGIATIHHKLQYFDSAIYFSNQAILQTAAQTYPVGVLQAATMLATLYESENKMDSALKYLKLKIELKDSLFSLEKVKAAQNVAFNEQLQRQQMKADQVQYRHKIRTYAILAIALLLLGLAALLWRNNRHKQNLNIKLQDQKEELQETLKTLKATQSQLVLSEKMASLGELTAGIAHEIENPLNFVNNFSDLSNELIDEMEEQIEHGNLDEAREISSDIKQNLEKISHHGKKADSIVKGMLLHSRSSSGVREPVDVNKTADEYLKLSYHGFRGKYKNFNAAIETDYDPSAGRLTVVPQDIGRVLLNLFNNAFYAVNERENNQQNGYEPLVSVATKRENEKVIISIKDNGSGMSQKVMDKIFQPFFTTKPTGQGTGLGLSLAYDIVKAHSGEIKVTSAEDEFTEFTISFPV
jgi:signal transduction histidine kinase